jgi:hypothetical protein
MEQLKADKSVEEIRASWEPGLIAFKKIRKNIYSIKISNSSIN